MSYSQLFSIYEAACADYGVMKDVLWDSKQTIESARVALREYRREPRRFKLVLVAQGKTVEEYLSCFAKLVELGAEHIAIGGLLRKRQASVRYMYVSSDLASEVLSEVRKEFGNRWLFVLGSYHPSRHELFAKHNVFGSDYKGWIFNYIHQRDQISALHDQVVTFESSLPRNRSVSQLCSERERLAHTEARQRLLYIQTKNDGDKDSDKKASIRKKFQKAQTRLREIDEELAAKRLDLVSRDGLPPPYKEAVHNLGNMLRSAEQAIRVRGVHEYLENRVYSQCVPEHGPDEEPVT